MAAIAMVAVVTSCGGSHQSQPAPPGSPSNPLVAQGNGGSEEFDPARDADKSGKAEEAPSYRQLVERQKARPRSRFTPCNLVTRAQAAAIIGTRLIGPVEAPQGPTCIYRSAGHGKQFVTLSVQYLSISRLAHQLENRKRIRVAHHAGVCGANGQPTLYVSVSKGRVLMIGAQCGVARKFAAKALPRLG